MGRGRWYNRTRWDINPQDYRIERCQRKTTCCSSRVSADAVSSDIEKILRSMWSDGCRPSKRKEHEVKNKLVSDNNIPEIVIQKGDE